MSHNSSNEESPQRQRSNLGNLHFNMQHHQFYPQNEQLNPLQFNEQLTPQQFKEQLTPQQFNQGKQEFNEQLNEGDNKDGDKDGDIDDKDGDIDDKDGDIDTVEDQVQLQDLRGNSILMNRSARYRNSSIFCNDRGFLMCCIVLGILLFIASITSIIVTLVLEHRNKNN